MDTQPLAREIVLVGGGHSHVLLLRMLGMNPVPGLRVTLISPHYLTPYSGMLPGLVAGHYTEDEAYIDLAPLCRFANAALVLDEAIG
ncbi:MAG: selenide, water dikinase SelD, partial [Pseudomonadales bacterium]